MNIRLWLLVGYLGQIMFSMRFLIQWLASEKKKKSTVPVSFWYFSIAGGILLLSYSIFRKDPVFMLGQSMGVVIYSRNLYLIHKKHQTN